MSPHPPLRIEGTPASFRVRLVSGGFVRFQAEQLMAAVGNGATCRLWIPALDPEPFHAEIPVVVLDRMLEGMKP